MMVTSIVAPSPFFMGSRGDAAAARCFYFFLGCEFVGEGGEGCTFSHYLFN